MPGLWTIHLVQTLIRAPGKEFLLAWAQMTTSMCLLCSQMALVGWNDLELKCRNPTQGALFNICHSLGLPYNGLAS